MTTTVGPRTPATGGLEGVPRFPGRTFASAGAYGAAYFEEWARASLSVDMEQLERAAAVLADAYATGATVYACGNGGSAAVADHLQCDHLKGVRTGTDLVPRVVSLASNVDLLTAIANDIGFEDVFVYQLESQSRPGDVLVVISSSGNSPNIVRALRWARANGLRTIALTGFDGGDGNRLAEVPVHVASSNYGVVEDLHQTLMHALAQYIRQAAMPAGAVAAATF